MAIPNTTPTPNELYNGEMKKMNDTELRVVLVVTRSTLGWVANKDTGMRKEEDWISRKQLVKKSGRSKRAVMSAIDTCIEKHWIEARDKDGNLLDTSKKRNGLGRGNKIFYRLGKVFLKNTIKCKRGNDCSFSKKKGQKDHIKGANSAPYKSNVTKEKNKESNNKQLIKGNEEEITGKEINEFIDLFKHINPNYEWMFKNKTQRESCKAVVTKIGRAKTKKLLKEILPQTNEMDYAPVITTAYQLERKLGDLIAFIRRKQKKFDDTLVKI